MPKIFWIFLLTSVVLQAADEWPQLTPQPGPAPRINSPQVYGARPEHPFVYRIPSSGERPMTFAADKLPTGMRLSSQTGIITGHTPAKQGRYAIVLRANNRFGSAAKTFTLVIGDQLALTPPMGWNDWYTHYDRIHGPVFAFGKPPTP